MVLHVTPRGSPVEEPSWSYNYPIARASESSSGLSNYSPIKSSKGSSGDSSYVTAVTSHNGSPIKSQTQYPYQSPTDSIESLYENTFVDPNNLKDADHTSIDARLNRVFDQFNQGQLREAQIMAKELLFCYPAMEFHHRASLHAMLGVYPFGLSHAEKACAIYGLLAMRNHEMRDAYENARESFAKAQKIDALWEAQEKKMDVFKHNRKEEFNGLVDAVSQPSSKSPSSSKSASQRITSDSSGSKDKSAKTDLVPSIEHKRQMLIKRLNLQDSVSKGIQEQRIAKYEPENKVQRKTSTQKMNSGSKGKSVQPDPVRMTAEDAQEPTPKARMIKKPEAFYCYALKHQTCTLDVDDVERQHALGTEKCTVNGTATAPAEASISISMVSEPSSTLSSGGTEETDGQTKDVDAKDDDEQSGTDRWTDISTLANMLYRTQLKENSHVATNGTALKGSGQKVVPAWDPYRRGDPSRGIYF
ncbi:hypothetical protein ACHAPD_008783 [Fusarium lateritium]